MDFQRIWRTLWDLMESHTATSWDPGSFPQSLQRTQESLQMPIHMHPIPIRRNREKQTQPVWGITINVSKCSRIILKNVIILKGFLNSQHFLFHLLVIQICFVNVEIVQLFCIVLSSWLHDCETYGEERTRKHKQILGYVLCEFEEKEQGDMLRGSIFYPFNNPIPASAGATKG